MINFRGKNTQQLMHYWLDRVKGDALPQRSDIDPIDMDTALLPHIFLCSVSYDPFEVYFRLQGTFINSRLGQNFKGKKIGPEIFGDAAHDINDLYYRLAHSQKPILSNEMIKSTAGTSYLVEIIHLPLVDESGTTRFVLGAIDLIDRNESYLQKFISNHWVVTTSNDVNFA